MDLNNQEWVVQTREMNKLKVSLGIKDNKRLDVYVKEFMGNMNASFNRDITPKNIGHFNKFLEFKIYIVGMGDCLI